VASTEAKVPPILPIGVLAVERTTVLGIFSAAPDSDQS
jgi:hypothetical protein